jgi:hypothetical protein
MIAQELSEEMSSELNFWPLSYYAYTFVGYCVVLSAAWTWTASNQMLVWLLTNRDTVKHNYIFCVWVCFYTVGKRVLYGGVFLRN